MKRPTSKVWTFLPVTVSRSMCDASITSASKISVMLTGGRVSLSAYIDNVLAQHFEQYREEIEEAYAGKLENLF